MDADADQNTCYGRGRHRILWMLDAKIIWLLDADASKNWAQDARRQTYNPPPFLGNLKWRGQWGQVLFLTGKKSRYPVHVPVN